MVTPPGTPTTEIFAAFLRLGMTSFGGPVAHIGYFHGDIVTRRRWLAETEFGDLVALCQFLPGPASSQLAFAIGLRRCGWIGALAASVGFLLPSAILMIALAYGIVQAGALAHVGWLQGLKVAAVAIVALAVLTMFRTLCPDKPRATFAIGGALIVILIPSAWGQVIALAAGAIAGVKLLNGDNEVARRLPPALPEAPAGLRRGDQPSAGLRPADASHHLRAGGIALGAWVVLLVSLPVIAYYVRIPAIDVFDRFYRAGSLVFGGGHVVLPLLREAVVPPGWVSDNVFLAGYGAAQALPGPLFSFAAYLGTAMDVRPNGWIGGLWALLAMYLPAWLVIGGALPLWDRLRRVPRLRAAMNGTNAAVVGLLIAALYNPVWTDGIQSSRQFGLGIVAFAALSLWRIPAWGVVIGCASIGAVAL